MFDVITPELVICLHLPAAAVDGVPLARSPPPNHSNHPVNTPLTSPIPLMSHILCAVMDGLLSSLDDPALALVQWNEAYAVVADRLPAQVAAELEACASGEC